MAGLVLCAFAPSVEGRAPGAEAEWMRGYGGSTLPGVGSDAETDSGTTSVKSDPNKIHA